MTIAIQSYIMNRFPSSI